MQKVIEAGFITGLIKNGGWINDISSKLGPTGLAALGGAAIGGGAGAFFSEKDRKVQNALLGALGGGTIGAAAQSFAPSNITVPLASAAIGGLGGYVFSPEEEKLRNAFIGTGIGGLACGLSKYFGAKLDEYASEKQIKTEQRQADIQQEQAVIKHKQQEQEKKKADTLAFYEKNRYKVTEPGWGIANIEKLRNKNTIKRITSKYYQNEKGIDPGMVHYVLDGDTIFGAGGEEIDMNTFQKQLKVFSYDNITPIVVPENLTLSKSFKKKIFDIFDNSNKNVMYYGLDSEGRVPNKSQIGAYR